MSREDDRFNSWLLGQAFDAFKTVQRMQLNEASEDEEEDEKHKADAKHVDDKHMKQADKPADKPDDSAQQDQSKHSETRGGPQQAKAAQRQTPAPDPDEVTLDIVVKKLNAIRSGPSFKDESVRTRIGEYFTELTSSERLALFAFLEGLAEVVAGHVDGDDARTPSDPDINVGMETTQTAKDVEEAQPQPRVVKGGDDTNTASRGGRTQQPRTSTGNAGSPPVERDAFSKSPVMVVRR